MNCSVITSTDSDEQAYALIKSFGFPLKDKKNKDKDLSI